MASTTSMETVRSADDTTIAFERTGSGPPLVLVHGATVDHTTWAEAVPYLEEHFTVYAMDRRGRGASGDAEAYSLDREVEDIVAVVESIDTPVALLGHSSGGLFSLEAALRTDRLRRLIVYEGVTLDVPEDETQAVVAIGEAIEAGDRDEALAMFYRELAYMTEEEIDFIRSQPDVWQRRVDAVHTSLREVEAGFDYEFDPDRLREMATPTLLLIGSESPGWVHQDAETLCDALPACRIAVLEGQQHVAYRMAPEYFADTVTEFLTATI